MTFIKGFIIRARAGRGQCGGLSRHWCQGRSSLRPGGGRSQWAALLLCSSCQAPVVGGGPDGGGPGGGLEGARTSCRLEEGAQGAGADTRAGAPCQGSRASESEAL